MAEVLTNKDNFLKSGFCVVRNLFNDEEIKRYQKEIEEICEKKGTKNAMDLYNYRNTWDYIVNARLLSILRNLLGSNVYYLHDMTIVNSNHTKPNSYSWHRDNPCRITGKGPDWDKNFPYNVVSTITYLTPNEVTNSGLSVIPFSHKNNYAYTFSNILRIFHYRTKNIKYLKFIRDYIEKKISTIIRTDPGDCIIFLCNLFHTGLPSKGIRQTIQTRFGSNGKHSENFVNYTLKYRKETFYEINNNNKETVEDFFDLLKKNNIYYPVAEKKENIEGVKVPKYEKN